MPDISRRRLMRTTAIYWMLLLYIIAALVWWFISLEAQNTRMRDLQISDLRLRVDSSTSPLAFREEINRIDLKHERNRTKYIGEGSIFFLLILVGAAFVYRSVRRQFNLQLQQQNFMMAVTHELKTPISVARLNLETLQKYSLDGETQKKLLRNTLDETERLNFLTNNILVSSQMESSSYRSSKEELDLSDLLKDCIQDFRNRFPERTIIEDVEPDGAIKGDPLLLQILINNLLENAIKYSSRESKIIARLKKIRSGMALNIIDEGPGIPEGEMVKIFNKFYRIGNEFTRKKQGTGLGLYLCRKIARDHNADISVTNNDGSGSNFAVIFHS
jgi:two-component system, OmpR family, sensor histidine kinase CiaH